MVQIQHACPGFDRDMLKVCDQSPHLAIAVFVELMNSAQRVNHQEFCASALFNQGASMLRVHQILLLTHQRLDGQVSGNGLPSFRLQMSTKAVYPVHDRDFRIFAGNVMHAPVNRWIEP
ncbi:hypothetical protein D3C80_1192040 [compost metagenome]